MIYINVWDISYGATSEYEVTIGNADEENAKANADYMDQHLIVRKFKDAITANAFAQQLYNIVSESKGMERAALNTL